MTVRRTVSKGYVAHATRYEDGELWTAIGDQRLFFAGEGSKVTF